MRFAKHLRVLTVQHIIFVNIYENEICDRQSVLMFYIFSTFHSIV